MLNVLCVYVLSTSVNIDIKLTLHKMGKAFLVNLLEYNLK